MVRLLQGKRILLGVSGGIAAYKAIELARELTLAGVEVDVVLSHGAHQFVTPLTFQTLTRRKIHSDVFEPWTETEQGHISLADQADALVVAPATAHTIAKLAHGLADDMLTAAALSCTAPVIVAPAMDHFMYLNAATQDNIQTLARRGTVIVGPDSGALASGLVGHGRLAEPVRIISALRAVLGRTGPLAGRRVVVSAGPTREAIDPIRFISNYSSGKMGYALAEACIDAGASVTLVSGPTSIRAPDEAVVVRVESAGEMARAVHEAVRAADVLIMAAAVGDYRPVEVATEKIKKTGSDVSLRLVRNDDILASVDRPGLVKVGFAAETTNLVDYARGKMASKRLDLIVANHGAETMGADRSQAIIIGPGDRLEELPALAKSAVAEHIVDRIAELLQRRTATVAQ